MKNAEISDSDEDEEDEAALAEERAKSIAGAASHVLRLRLFDFSATLIKFHGQRGGGGGCQTGPP